MGCLQKKTRLESILSSKKEVDLIWIERSWLLLERSELIFKRSGILLQRSLQKRVVKKFAKFLHLSLDPNWGSWEFSEKVYHLGVGLLDVIIKLVCKKVCKNIFKIFASKLGVKKGFQKGITLGGRSSRHDN